MNNYDKETQKIISRKILKYGETVLRSENFQAAYSETHHLKGILADHILNVTIVGCRLCMGLQKRKIPVNEEIVILACLCHDLGMTGREEFYKDRLSSWKEHAKESVKRAEAFLPDLDPEVASAIETHMWPVSGRPPRTREGWIVLRADKIASGIDWLSFLRKEPWQPKIKEWIKLRSE